MNTCSKPGLLLPLSQMAVGAKMGMGSWRRAGRFGPPFPLNEVGDPALSQRGGLCHMVPHCLRDTWAKREREGERSQRESDIKTELNLCKSTKVKKKKKVTI